MPRASQITVTKNLEFESDTSLTNRLIAPDGTQLVQGDITGTITVEVFDISGGGAGRSPSTAIFTKTDIAVASTVFDTYQTDGYFDGKDDTGYNFRYTLLYDSAGSTGPALVAGHKYGVKFSLEMTSFGTGVWRHVLDFRPEWG